MPQRADIVAKAVSFDGYLGGQGFNTANRFSQFLGHPTEAWCGDFVTAVYAMCGLPLPSMQPGQRTGFTYVPDAWAYGKNQHATRNSWEAKPGDIVCYDWDGSGQCTGSDTHTGIVDHWAAGTLHTIEGNTSPGGGVHVKPRPAPAGTGSDVICGVIDAGQLVSFGSGPTPTDGHDQEVPPFPGRTLMLKSPNMTGDDVKRWQLQMRHRGWRLPTDGNFDAGTRDTCLAFQQKQGLPATGGVDAQTWAAAWTAPKK
jgi:hypothetical protein